MNVFPIKLMNTGWISTPRVEWIKELKNECYFLIRLMNTGWTSTPRVEGSKYAKCPWKRRGRLDQAEYKKLIRSFISKEVKLLRISSEYYCLYWILFTKTVCYP